MRMIDADGLIKDLEGCKEITKERMIGLIESAQEENPYAHGTPIEVFNLLVKSPNKDALCELIDYLVVWKNHYEDK